MSIKIEALRGESLGLSVSGLDCSFYLGDYLSLAFMIASLLGE
jgi:hypothetical protein